MMLSQYFSWEEAAVSQEAARRGIDNSIPRELHANVERMARVMDSIRSQLGRPIHVSSWYRCPALNKALPGSARNSAHMVGLAVDCISPDIGPPLAFAKAISQLILVEPLDQIIHENGQWVHVALPQGGLAREQLLTMRVRRKLGRVLREYQPGLVPLWA